MAAAQEAEAWGLSVGLDALCAQPAARAVIVGDSLNTIRFGAAQARLRNPALQAILEPGIGRLAGWGLPDWYAVRRRFNKAADKLAGIASRRAADLRREGRFLASSW